MKKLLIVIAVLLFATSASAAPFIVCDPQAGVVGYEITGLGDKINFIAQQDGSLRYDLASIQSGTYNLTFAACNMWGCSAATAADPFTKAVPSAPAGLRIVAD